MSVMPHCQEIDTPWEPQEIVWRSYLKAERLAAFQQQIDKKDQSHLVREIWVENPLTGIRVTSPKEARNALVYAEREFDLLRTCGIEVLTPEWHIFVGPTGRAVTLAKTAIIDGLNPALERIRPATRSYSTCKEPGPRLIDLDKPEQYIVGTPRSSGTAHVDQANVHYIDFDTFYRIPG